MAHYRGESRIENGVRDVDVGEEGSYLSDDERTPPWGDLSHLVAGPTHYNHAPIVEAIVELIVELPENVALDDLATTMQGEKGFAEPEQAVAVAGQFQVTEDELVASASGQRVGYVFRRDDGLRVVQAHRDRFIFSSLGRYSDWAAFVAEAEMAWDRYVSVTRPLRVTRIGVRFVNRIEIPYQSVEIKDYLRTSIDVSPYLPQLIAQLFMQITIPLVQHECFVTITSALAPPPGEKITWLILDIDAKRDVRLERSEDGFSEAVSGVLSTLRDAKNFVFEACITDATRGLIR